MSQNKTFSKCIYKQLHLTQIFTTTFIRSNIISSTSGQNGSLF